MSSRVKELSHRMMRKNPRRDKMRKEKHVFLMILCCLVPLGVVLALLAIGGGGWAIYSLFLLCPLLHIFLMREHADLDRSRNPKDNSRPAQHRGKST